MSTKRIAELNATAFAMSGMNDQGHSVVPVEGDRMAPTLRHGDCVLVDPSVTCYSGAGLYVLDRHGDPAVYRADVSINGGFRLISDNKLYGGPEKITRADFDRGVLGKVIALGQVLDRAAMERLAGGAS